MRKFGKFEVLEKIGAGGFGAIYKGYDPFIQRYVAIKTCTSEDDATRKRFTREATIAGNLHHRNITTVYDLGVEGDVPFLVQEFLGGEDLDRKIRRRDSLSTDTRLLYLMQVARGLEYAHARGVAHRDIKPANVRILPDDTAKIMDFGVAKLIHEDSDLTKTGMTVGTASYVSPEQIRGEAIDHRTDIFSFGTLAFELLTYEPLFAGSSFSEVFRQIMFKPPRRLRDTAPDYPEPLSQLVSRCLEKHPADRYADCGEIVAEIARLRHGEAPESGSR